MFAFSGIVRIALLIGVALLVARELHIQDNAFWAFLLWVGGLYMVMVFMEALWVARGSAAEARKGGN